MINEGTYEAKVASHAITETKNGDPQALVTFDVKTTDGVVRLDWYGSFKEKALKYTLTSLINCGLRGTNPADDLEIGKVVSIVVSHEPDTNGKTRARIKWINKVGGTRKVLEPKAAAAKLKSLEGMVMAIRHDLGAPNADTDDLPF